MTPHNSANLGDIAKVVIMPGDPLRAKYIAENFLNNVKIVSNVRGIACYTGYYKNKEISVMAHGMGMPSMGIYSYELFHFYNVESIIRIGTCGGFKDGMKLLDLILSEEAYTEGSYALSLDNIPCNLVSANSDLNLIIEKTAKELNIDLIKGTTLSNDCFSPYVKHEEELFSRIPVGINAPIASEMEAFSLFYNAKKESKKAACLLTVVDIPTDLEGISSDKREKSLDTMINLALESAIKISTSTE
jgi:purine-nucleoside phosphorylase